MIIGAALTLSACGGTQQVATRTVTREATSRPSVPQRPTGSTRRPQATPALTFSGNGERNLGTINLPRESIVHWTNRLEPGLGGYLDIEDRDYRISIHSSASHGESVVHAGRYVDVDVDGSGDWTLRFVPRAR